MSDQEPNPDHGVTTPCPPDSESARALTPEEIAEAIEHFYPQFKGIVRARLARHAHRPAHQITFSPTEFANELCIGLMTQPQPFRSREHLMGVATVRCSQIIIDYLRRRSRLKRGGGVRPDPISENIPNRGNFTDDIIFRDGFEQALTQFTHEYPAEAWVLTLKVAFGLTNSEIAEIAEISTATVERYLRAARVYLIASLE